MATGTYGINIPSNVDPSEVEIYYSYTQDRTTTSSEDATFTKLSSNFLVKAKREASTDANVSGDTTIEGMYQLKLPTTYFSTKGYYTVYIKPKEISATIADVSVLAAYANVRGIVIDSNTITDSAIKTLIQTNNGLVGYRIVYYDDNGDRMNDFKIVTSNFRSEPVIQNLSNSNEKSVRYTYNDTGSLIFLTVTPSSSMSFKANSSPFIGKTSQQILLINTKFSPIAIEIEMVDHDEDTISAMLENSKIRNLDNGLITTLNNDGEIYHQSESYGIKNSSTGDAMYEINKKKDTDIDFSQTLDNIENA
jgi:hypothetical protein